jgi:ketosteroid isomerase-like protein
MWSTQDPVTVLGAMKDVIGAEEARQAFRWLATRFSNCTDYRFELVAAGASGDLAYTVGYEHTAFSLDGGPVTRSPCASPMSTVARAASGRSSTATPTPPDRSAPSR